MAVFGLDRTFANNFAASYIHMYPQNISTFTYAVINFVGGYLSIKINPQPATVHS